MYPDQGCSGEVALGPLPPEVQERLSRVPGVWLEYDVETSMVEVRHAQPTSGPDLPIITGELVQLLAEIPVELHASIPGGTFYVHTLDTSQFVRLHVARGGLLELRWARPEYAGAARKPYRGREETRLDPVVHKLNGKVRFFADEPMEALQQLKYLADTFEGLYPEGHRAGEVDENGRVSFVIRDLNLDAHLLVSRLVELARPGSLDGKFTVDSFGEPSPEHHIRIVFEKGEVLAQHPVLWKDVAAG